MRSSDPAESAQAESAADIQVDLRAAYEGAGVQELLDQLDRELIGLKPVKARIREIAALLVVNRARQQVGLETAPPSLHMSFTGRPGTG
ncbi:MAG: CbbX protein, partial [Cyanobium sp.]